MERCYRIADIGIRVLGEEEWMYQEDGVLTPFREDDILYEHTLQFEVVEELLNPEGQMVYKDSGKRIYHHNRKRLRYIGPVQNSANDAYMCIQREGEQSLVQVKRSMIGQYISPKMVLNAMEAEHLVAMHQGVLFHSSFIKWNDQAILFTAPSGTGKSTQADLWCRFRGAELMNGDRSAVRCFEDKIYACGIPFSGSSGVGKQCKIPLRTIVYLSQAPQNSLKALCGARAFRRIWEGCSVNSWNAEDVENCMQTVSKIAETIPIYHLACTPDESAVEILEQILVKGGI